MKDGYLQWISVQQNQDLRLINLDEICYFRSDSKHTAVVTAETEYQVRTPLQQLREQLDPKRFWPVQGSLVVNVNAIRSVHRDLRGHLEIRLWERMETLPVAAANAHLFKHL